MSFHLGSNELLNFLYLSSLLLFLMVSVLSRRQTKVWNLIKQLSLWATFTLIIIAIYSFRYDFYALKNRIVAELLPARAVRLDSSRVVLRASKDGHFYADLKVNGKFIRFMIDTGASDIVLSVPDAVTTGLNINDLAFTREYQTANGIIFGAPVNLTRVELGDIIFNNLPASINQADLSTSLLGMKFLRQFKKYEFYQDQLVLTY